MKPIVLVESAKPPENLNGRDGVVSMMGSLKNVGIKLSNETEWLGLISNREEPAHGDLLCQYAIANNHQDYLSVESAW